MSAGRAGGRTGALAWAAAAVSVALLAALTVFVAGVLLRDGDSGGAPSGPPQLREAVTLRAAPDEGAAPVASLGAGATVVLRGRSRNGAWLVVELPGRLDVVGWVPAGVVENAGDVLALPVVEAPVAGEPSPVATATQPGAVDLPDLVLEEAFVRENRLVIVVRNAGLADAVGPIYASVDGGIPQRVDAGDKPLRPGDSLEAVLTNEYVQLRAAVEIEVGMGLATVEARGDNNRLETVVVPDRPNDLEVFSAALHPDDGHLVVTVRNNSVIPLVGTVTLAVRRAHPESELLERLQAPLEVDSLGIQEYDFDQLIDVDLTRIEVILESDAINDADRTNNVYPR